MDTNKGVSIVVVVLSAIVVIIFAVFVYQQFFKSESVSENIDFNRTGNLIMNNPGFEEGVWYLIYETPGSPANSVKLSFDENSSCGNKNCSDLKIGERVSVSGLNKDGSVIVKKLESL